VRAALGLDGRGASDEYEAPCWRRGRERARQHVTLLLQVEAQGQHLAGEQHHACVAGGARLHVETRIKSAGRGAWIRCTSWPVSRAPGL
jgi:hypothetical protein